MVNGSSGDQMGNGPWTGLEGQQNVSILKVTVRMVNSPLENFNPTQEPKMSSRGFLLDTNQ